LSGGTTPQTAVTIESARTGIATASEIIALQLYSAVKAAAMVYIKLMMLLMNDEMITFNSSNYYDISTTQSPKWFLHIIARYLFK